MQTRKTSLPLIAKWIISRLSIYENNFALTDIIEEEYLEIQINKGKTKARIWYWIQVMNAFIQYGPSCLYRSKIMFKNYLIIALRIFKRNPGYSLINITGLAVGFACCMIILLIVHNDLTYDSFHSKADRIFLLKSTDLNQPSPLAPFLKQNYPEVVNSARFYFRTSTLQYIDKVFEENRLAFADPDFLEMFDFQLVTGNSETILDKPYTVLITEEMAVKYFGEEDPVGKLLSYNDQYSLTVSGILKNIPDNSHLKFDFLVSFLTLTAEGMSNFATYWGNHYLFTYIELKQNLNYPDFIPKIENIVIEKVPKLAISTKLTLLPLKKIHLYENGAIKYVYIFSVIAVLVLLVASANFINLSTARVNTRFREIGIRKVIGGTRSMLAKQFLGESVLISVISGFIAILITVFLLPVVNSIAGVNFTPSLLIKNRSMLLILILLIPFTGVFSGIYPALFLSGFNPVSLVRGSGGNRGMSKVLRRKILVVFQFTISIFLIIATGIIYKQLEYIRTSDLGFEKEHLVYMRLKSPIIQNSVSFKNELLRNPEILNVSLASSLPSYIGNEGSGMDWDGKQDNFKPTWPFAAVDPDYISTIGLEFIEGRDFSSDLQTDIGGSYIVNEKAVKTMGYDSPVGKRFALWGNEGTIIGVLKDFHFRPLHREIEPLIVLLRSDLCRYAIIRVKPVSNFSETFMYIKEVWNRFAQSYPFEIKFLDESFQENYLSEQRMSTIFRYFTIFTLFISCLGLLGLVSCVAEQRTKEIGIRKTLGAGFSSIVGLVGKEFLLLIVLSNILAWPITYFTMNKWLNNFAYHTEISYMLFFMSFLAALLLTIFTIGFQIFKFAHTRPVDSLKYE
ncbi:ABC transporter permease [candidate division KSB1 bacterium]